MPDWEALVSARLGPLELEEHLRDEVIVELANHLEELYLERRAEGASETEAMERTLAQLSDWTKLAQKIRDAKRVEGSMNDRTRRYWLPGLVSFTASMVWEMILVLLIPRFRVTWYPADYFGAPHIGLLQHTISQTGMQIYTLSGPYLIWLLTQPVFGALGAHLSRRGGGERSARLVSGMFPSIVTFLVLGFVVVMVAFVERNQYVRDHPTYAALIVIPWVVLPGVALMLGVLPFLREQGGRPVQLFSGFRSLGGTAA
jgi:hypothetical protein